MNDPLIALNKVRKILESWRECDPAENAKYSACKVLIGDLERFRQEHGHTGYIAEKLGALNWHIDAMFGADIDNGHDFEKHLVWALGAAGVLLDVHWNDSKSGDEA